MIQDLPSERVGGRRAAGRWAIGPIRFLRCRSAAIAPLTALMIVPIIGGIAYSVELGTWTYTQRSMQNAADSAALAAATINSGAATTGSTSQNEARAAAAKFGFANGTNGVTVTSALTACPAGVTAGSICYEAVLNTTTPFSFSGILGLTGNQTIRARAIAIAAGSGTAPTNQVCVWTFTNLQTNGTPDANLAGCSVLSNGGMTCTGNGLHADYAVAGGNVSGSCAQNVANQKSNQTSLPADPYAGLANTGIPANTCPGYDQFDKKGEVPAANQLSGSYGGEKKVCGDAQLTGNVTLTGNATKLVIYNGRLDLNRFTLKTATGASATVIFTGTTNSTYHHYPVDNGKGSGSGILEIEAPTGATDAFKDVAIYQDPRLGNTNVGFTYAGNKPAWKITGVIYLPYATTIFSGVVDKADDGASCQILVGNNITINGTGKIIGDVSGCAAAGISPPLVTVGTGAAYREKLVL